MMHMSLSKKKQKKKTTFKNEKFKYYFGSNLFGISNVLPLSEYLKNEDLLFLILLDR